MLQLNLFDLKKDSFSISSNQLIFKLDALVLLKTKLIVEVGNAIAQLIAQGTQISPQKLSCLMCASFGGTDAQGVWQWKDAYEAMEAGLVIYLRQYGKTFTTESSTFMLKHLLGIQALLPTQTKRSVEQISLQQFSTPISLAYCVAKAAQINSSDLVLEPSAGTGLLAVWAELAEAKLILNELHQIRKELLIELFPRVSVSQVNAEQIDDLLARGLSPSVVIMNPPFSASPNTEKRNPFATFKHIKSSLMRLQSGGRLVAITANWFSPNNHYWQDLFTNQLEKYGAVIFSSGIEGSAYSKHGVNIEMRITVIDRIPSTTNRVVIDECLGLTQLLEEIQKLPPRNTEYPKAKSDIPLVSSRNLELVKPRLDLAVQLTSTKDIQVVIPPKTLTGFGEIIELDYEVIDWDRSTKSLGSGRYEGYEPNGTKLR